MNPVKNLRIRYTIGLSAIACLICLTFFLLHRTIEQQENYARVINIAGSQLGLVNRIAFFASQMGNSETEDDFFTARQQLGRAINQMRKNHDALIAGDPDRGVPKITTPLLETIYFDPQFGLDQAFTRFVVNARQIHGTEPQSIAYQRGAIVYVTNVGPFVLETLLEAAVSEYEAFSRSEIKRLKSLEIAAAVSALILLALEAIFIFRPFERSLKRSVEQISRKTVALTKEKARAEAASQSKTAFLATVSHELRTPLNAIVGFSEALLAGVYGPLQGDKQAERIADVRRSGLYLIDLVSDILDISAAEGGQLDVNPVVVRMSNLFAGSVAAVGAAHETAGVSVQVDDAEPGLAVKVDERRVKQVLINLLGNAIKFTPQGGRIVLKSLILPDGRAGFSVTDTGIGMTKQEIKVARERFGQVEGPMARQHHGTGLGLSIAIDLVALHGGTLDIDSEKGRGTVVTVLFPSERTVLDQPSPVAANVA